MYVVVVGICKQTRLYDILLLSSLVVIRSMAKNYVWILANCHHLFYAGSCAHLYVPV